MAACKDELVDELGYERWVRPGVDELLGAFVVDVDLALAVLTGPVDRSWLSIMWCIERNAEASSVKCSSCAMTSTYPSARR